MISLSQYELFIFAKQGRAANTLKFRVDSGEFIKSFAVKVSGILQHNRKLNVRNSTKNIPILFVIICINNTQSGWGKNRITYRMKQKV